MWWIGRRGFLGSLFGALPVLFLPKAPWVWARAELDPARLRSIAEVALPSSLRPDGTARVVDAFAAWLAGYRPGAERSHGYGSGSMEILYLPPDPTPRWQAQLDELDATAQERLGVDFGSAPPDARRVILRERLAADASSGLASPAEADHVAAALMAFYFDSADAADLAYGGAIGKETCRSLDTVGEKPAPVGREARR